MEAQTCSQVRATCRFCEEAKLSNPKYRPTDFMTDAIHVAEHIKLKLPAKIHFDNVKNLIPQRRNYLSEAMVKKTDDDVASNRPIYFMPTAVKERPIFVAQKMVYSFGLYGILPCGQRASIIITGVKVYFDVEIPGTEEEQVKIINNIKMCIRVKFGEEACDIKYENHFLYPVREFSEHPNKHLRIICSTLQLRKAIYAHLKESELTLGLPHEKVNGGFTAGTLRTSSDEMGGSNYYLLKCAREYKISMGGWSKIDNYTLTDSHLETARNVYNFEVHIDDFLPLPEEDRLIISRANNEFSRVMENDNTMVCSWDIETYRLIQNGQVPTPEDKDFTIFMINSSYFWHYTDKELVHIVCVDVDLTPKAGIAIVCDTKENVLIAHAQVLKAMLPNMFVAFNGANFDWPLCISQYQRYGILHHLFDALIGTYKCSKRDSIDKQLENFVKFDITKNVNIKINADSSHTAAMIMNVTGYLDIDIMPIFLKMYPKLDVRKGASLNYFLSLNGLQSKEDMHYRTMFKIYARALALREAEHSCHCSSGVISPHGKNENINMYKHCDLCAEIVKEIDCKQVPGSKLSDPVYDSEQLLDSLLDNKGNRLCCHCGKRPQNLLDMGDVAYYCTIDCVRPQQLCLAQTVLNDKRGISDVSFCTLYNAYYNADGMKVRNLIAAECHMLNVAFSGRAIQKHQAEKDHYPGAHVIPPKIGLEDKDPVTSLDFQSLYPSLAISFNLSPNMYVANRARAEELIRKGYDIHHVTPFEYSKGEKKGAPGNTKHIGEGFFVRHNGIRKQGDRKVIAYEKYFVVDGKEVIAGRVAPNKVMFDATRTPRAAHVNFETTTPPSGTYPKYRPIYGRDALPGERMGILPSTVKRLFDSRIPLKIENGRLTKILEIWQTKIETENLDPTTYGEVILLDGEQRFITYEDLDRRNSKLTSKQKAIKLMSNTCYGESGNFRSPIYNLFVAAGITCSGQTYLKLMADFVTKHGYKIKYGDTDSLYMTCPDSVYGDLLARMEEELKHLRNKPEDIKVKYWTQMVKLVMADTARLNAMVTEFLIGLTGTDSLSMSYEEILFKVLFCGRKKYFGIPHIGAVNFYKAIKDLFVRGIDVVKQGQTAIFKQLGTEFMSQITHPGCTMSPLELAKLKMNELYSMSVNVALFKKTARYRAHKKNVSVQTMVAKMRYDQAQQTDSQLVALYEPPEDGDKFDYVVVKQNTTHSIDGKKIKYSKGDCMMHVRIFEQLQSLPDPPVIDMQSYVNGGIIGLFARFVCSDPLFQPASDSPLAIDDGSKGSFKKLDAYRISEAIKYLTAYCDELAGCPKSMVKQMGLKYKSSFRQVTAEMSNFLLEKYGCLSVLLTDKYYGFSVMERDNIIPENVLNVLCAHVSLPHVVTYPLSKESMYHLCCSDEPYSCKSLSIVLRKMQNNTQNHTRECIPGLLDVVEKLNKVCSERILILRDSESSESMVMDDFITDDNMRVLTGLHKLIIHHRAILETIHKMKCATVAVLMSK